VYFGLYHQANMPETPDIVMSLIAEHRGVSGARIGATQLLLFFHRAVQCSKTRLFKQEGRLATDCRV
jgi:hypothetical protein